MRKRGNYWGHPAVLWLVYRLTSPLQFLRLRCMCWCSLGGSHLCLLRSNYRMQMKTHSGASKMNSVNIERSSPQRGNRVALFFTSIQLIFLIISAVLLPNIDLSRAFDGSYPGLAYFFLLASFGCLSAGLRDYVIHKYVRPFPALAYRDVGLAVLGLIILEIWFFKGRWRTWDTLGLILTVGLTLVSFLKLLKRTDVT